MKYGLIKTLNLKASRIVFGCAVPVMQEGNDYSEILSCAVENGINIFDTGRVYGKSEISLGKWLVNQNRKNVIIETKCCHYDLETNVGRVGRESALYDIEKSLECLKTDYVDILLLHRDDPEKDVGEIVSFMNEIVDKGYARSIGVSNWKAERVDKANKYAELNGLKPFGVSSPHYGLAEQLGDPYGFGCVTITGTKSKLDREWYKKEQMPIFSYSSLAGGLLSGRYKADGIENQSLSPQILHAFYNNDNIERLRRAEIMAKEKGVSVAQIALAWLFGDEMNVFTIVGCHALDNVLSNCKATELELNLKEREWLNLE